MSEMIERVARAIIVARFGHVGLTIFDPVAADYPDREQAQKAFDKRTDDARLEARSAIEAMREPTDEMIKAAE